MNFTEEHLQWLRNQTYAELDKERYKHSFNCRSHIWGYAHCDCRFFRGPDKSLRIKRIEE